MNWKKKAIVKTIGASINALALVNPTKAAQKAVDIFCTPRLGKLREKDLEVLNTATRWVELSLNGEKIQCYEWEGSGKKVLLAHGWESNSARWKNMIRSLQKADCHVIAMDAPAHGGSGSNHFQAVKYAAAMNVVIQHFHIERMIGHSVGGFATIIYLSEYPNSIEKAVTMGAPTDLSVIFKHYWDMMGYSQRVREAMSAYFLQIFGKEVAYYKLKEIAKKVSTQGLVIHDRDDLICSFSGGETLHQSWQNSTFLATEKLGHGYQDKKVYHAVRDFVR
jgi:pimeloyl-ACP methyl ester carboxylesterase